MFFEISKLQLRIREYALNWFRKYSIPRWMIFIHDGVAVYLTYLFACILRFNFEVQEVNYYLELNQAFLTVGVFSAFSIIFRTYSGMIRHTTIIDVFYVFLTSTSTFIILVIISLVMNYTGWTVFPRLSLSILTIQYVLITVYLLAVRLSAKTLYHLITSTNSKKKKVLIYGAGALGVIVKKLLMSDIKGEYLIVGFIDKNRNLHGKKLNGIPVYSPKELTTEFIHKHQVEIMIFAIKDILPNAKSEIVRTAVCLGLEVRDVPAVENWMNGELQIRQIEKVKLEDLLGRDPIELNLKRIAIGLSGKIILVTGAAGSIGSEIVRQLIKFPIKKLVLVDQAETPMFHLEKELCSSTSQCNLELILADITLPDKMEQVFTDFHPDMVFHAAAYKHVPVMEDNPHEAIRVNVGGTKLITRLAVKYGVQKFVMISTDKAVNPTNIMGASKRLCEMIVQQRSKKPGNTTQFIITRFGNVLGSNGSVIPIFKKQIEEGGPVTVTHPEITRYFMTIPEACQLVLEAGFMGHGGEIFVFDMGKPIKIVDLANQMIRLSGLTPDKDIKVTFTGLRPGEKLHEELLASEEESQPTYHPKIKIAQVKKVKNEELLSQIQSLLKEVYHFSKKEVAEIFKLMVPEYNTNNVEYFESPLPINKNAEMVSEDETVLKQTFQALKGFITFKSKLE